MTPRDAPPPHAAPAVLTLYYDGGPVCTREIGFYQRGRGAEQINWVNLAACDDAALGSDLSREVAYARLHARLPDGTLLSGARAFAVLWGALPAFGFVGRVAALPGVVHGLEIVYRGFLRLRRLWRRDADTCPLPVKDRPS